MKFAALILTLVPSLALGKTVAGSVTFVATAVPPIGSPFTVDGEGGKVSGTVDAANTGELTVALKDLTTSMWLRDEHMRDYLQIATYPAVKLDVKSVGAGGFQGMLTLHGKTKPVVGDLKIQGSHGKAHFTVKLSDFGFETLTKLGVVVQDKIEVNAEVDAK